MGKLAIINLSSSYTDAKNSQLIGQSYLKTDNDFRVFTQFDFPLGKDFYTVKQNKFLKFWTRLFNRIRSLKGFHNKNFTNRLILELDFYKPSVILIYSLGNLNLNIPLLVKYLNELGVCLVWKIEEDLFFEKDKTLIERVSKRHKKMHEKIRQIKKIVFITNTAKLKEKMKNSLYVNYPIVNIYDGVNLQHFNFYAIDKNNKTETEENTTYILTYVDCKKNNKIIEKINEISANLPANYQLLVSGNIDHNYLEKKIKYVDDWSYSHRPYLYDIADIFLCLDTVSYYPTFMFEAIVNGLPIIAIESLDNNQIIKKDIGKLTSDNKDEIISDIIELKNYPIPRILGAKKGLKYSLKVMADNYLSVIEQVEGNIVIYNS